MKKATKSTKISKRNTLGFQVKKVPRDLDRKTSPWLEEYQDFFTYRMQPVSEGFLERIANELIHHAETSDVLRLEWFFTQKRIDPTTARDWAAKYPNFGKAYKMAKAIIGMRRENGALHGDFNHATMMVTQGLYDELYKQAEDKQHDKEKELITLRAQLAKEAQNPHEGNYNIYIDGFKLNDKKELDGQ